MVLRFLNLNSNILRKNKNDKLMKTMAIFAQSLNPILGKVGWKAYDDDYDYHQEVANAGFGDMLHDSERNQKYFIAIRKTIKAMHDAGRKVHVLDIGTGTGILAMMSVKAGADQVTACEAFLPMANCAEAIIQANGMQGKIKLIKKRSTDVTIGNSEDDDIQEKANLLVTEILDTELIGEGALGIYNHAHEFLLTEDALCIPAKAKCYAQVANSALAAQWNSLKILADLDGEVLLTPPKAIRECKGEANLHDIQLSQIPLEMLRLLTEPAEIFEFDFQRKTSRELKRSKNIVMQSIASGSSDFVFYWWSIDLDCDGEVNLSCAPFWAHPDFKKLAMQEKSKRPLQNCIPWRDHWMQAIYYIPKPLHLTKTGEEFLLACNHDEFSLWFDAFKQESSSSETITRHNCTCNLHIAFGRSRIGQLNQSHRNKRFISVLEESIKPGAHVLALGDGCILSLATIKFGAKKVFCCESNRTSRQFMESIIAHNNLNSSVEILEDFNKIDDSMLSNISHIIAEPYFLTSILPWDNFYFGTLLSKILPKLPPELKVMPHAARIYAVGVEFLDLHKIRSPVGMCEGFDLSRFDQMVEKSTTLSQAKIEAQPLWEYPCRALSLPEVMLDVTFTEFDENKENSGSIGIKSDGSCNGIVLWVDWHLDASERSQSIISTGPIEPIIPNRFIKFDMFVRQGVNLIGKPLNVRAECGSIDWSVTFMPNNGDINFNFNVKST